MYVVIRSGYDITSESVPKLYVPAAALTMYKIFTCHHLITLIKYFPMVHTYNTVTWFIYR